jgi:hypothetical protein
MGGWLAMTEGVYYSAGPISVMMVREIAPPRQSWDAAAAAFLARRTQSLAPFGP